MASVFALSSFRSCTASLSSKTLSRTALSHVSRTSPYSRRHYSEQKTEEPTDKQEKPAESSQTEGKSPEEVIKAQSEKLKAKEAEVTDLMSRLRYLQADFVNLQRNSAREKEQTRDFAITRFASELLKTADSLDLALKNVPAEFDGSTTEAGSNGSKSPEAYIKVLRDGVDITKRQLDQTLFQFHIKAFDPTGDKFDPNRHEATYQVPMPDKEPGTVLHCQSKGYTIKDRILRAAQVGIVQEQ